VLRRVCRAAFENPFGVFDYRNLKRDAFFGYLTIEYSREDVVVAEPEKALLDHWHLTPGEWTAARLTEMRYQHMDRITEDKLQSYAERFRSPRLRRAVGRLARVGGRRREGNGDRVKEQALALVHEAPDPGQGLNRLREYLQLLVLPIAP